VFEKVISTFSSGEMTAYRSKFNPTQNQWGSHVELLAAAAVSTTGDILELGTGFFSTPLLHQIVMDQVSASDFQFSSNVRLIFVGHCLTDRLWR
jgi:hypothetical protein